MKQLSVQAPPHERSKMSVTWIMCCVLLALIPAAVSGCMYYGRPAVVLLLTTTCSAFLLEFVALLIRRRTQIILDCSALVTGLMFGLMLPPEMPLWQAEIGCFAAAILVKQAFGGLGRNLVNPAAAGRIVLLIAFASAWNGTQQPEHASVSGLLFGNAAGSIGETSAAAILLGGVFLWLCGIISAVTPAAFAGSYVLCAWIAGNDVLTQLLSGTLLFAAVFTAGDSVTTPLTKRGKLLFGLGCGCAAFGLRQFFDMTVSVTGAVLLMNLLTPLIDRITGIRPFGTDYFPSEASIKENGYN